MVKRARAGLVMAGQRRSRHARTVVIIADSGRWHRCDGRECPCRDPWQVNHAVED